MPLNLDRVQKLMKLSPEPRIENNFALISKEDNALTFLFHFPDVKNLTKSLIDSSENVLSKIMIQGPNPNNFTNVKTKILIGHGI